MKGRGLYEKRKGTITWKEERFSVGADKLSYSLLYMIDYRFSLQWESPWSSVLWWGCLLFCCFTICKTVLVLTQSQGLEKRIQKAVPLEGLLWFYLKIAPRMSTFSCDTLNMWLHKQLYLLFPTLLQASALQIQKLKKLKSYCMIPIKKEKKIWNFQPQCHWFWSWPLP